MTTWQPTSTVPRERLNSGTQQHYIGELSVTGLTSNPTISDHAIKNRATYDDDICPKAPSAYDAFIHHTSPV